MKVVYELDINDIKQMIEEKYGVKAEKIAFPTASHLECRIDMSDIESWEPAREEPKQLVEEDDIPSLNYIEPEETPAPEKEVNTDYDLTDEEIKNFIENNISVAELCRRYGFDKKAQYRLYKRFEKARWESAS